MPQKIGLITRTLRKSIGQLTNWIIMNFFMLAIYAFLGTVLFGDYSEDFRHIGASCNFLIQVLLGANDPFEAMDKADNYGLGGIAAFYVGTYYLINFFVLLNMFLGMYPFLLSPT